VKPSRKQRSGFDPERDAVAGRKIKDLREGRRPTRLSFWSPVSFDASEVTFRSKPCH
jgi:hypothetical protein